MVDPAIRPLTVADASGWRELRLEMLERDPQGFFADLDQAKALTDDEWRRGMPAWPDVILGLFDGGSLVGSCGFYVEKLPKLAHKGQMWGVYVRPAFRRRGCAEALVRATIAHARSHVEVLLTGASRAGRPSTGAPVSSPTGPSATPTASAACRSTTSCWPSASPQKREVRLCSPPAPGL